jgi:ElaB/YqjD/DUF883 family membrane-anchored ribosome-binding protein
MNNEYGAGMRPRWTASEERDPADIERDLDATRSELRATLEALEKRLSVDRLVEMTVGRVRERGGQFAGNLGEAIAANPVAILLASVGLGWMMLDRRREAPRRAVGDEYGSAGSAFDSAKETFDSAKGTVGAAVGAMSDRMHGAIDTSRDTMARARDSMNRARDTMGEAAATARDRIEHAHVSFDRMLEEQPLVLGAIGLAAGALIGALLPASETENRWLGEAREGAVKTAANAAREEVDAVVSAQDTDSDDDSHGHNGHDPYEAEQAPRPGRDGGIGRPAGQTH